MKKNWTMRVALLVVALTLITSCFVGGTFAKYVTGATAEDTARVAKFGVTVEADGALFATQYETDDDTLTDEEAAIVGKYSVVAFAEEGKDADNVVAPGTTYEGGTIALAGQPEVAVRVGYTIDIKAEGWNLPVEEEEEPSQPSEEPSQESAIVEPVSDSKATREGEDEGGDEGGDAVEEAKGEEYFPIIFTVNGVQYKVGKAEEETEAPAKADTTEIKLYDNLEALIAGIKEDVEALSAVYAANTDLAGEIADGADAAEPALSISWEWPFYVSDDNDVKDTALGDAAAAGNAATLEVSIGVTVTQID